jgi:DNA replication protein DnaC
MARAADCLGHGYRVYYTRAAALFQDLSLARADGSLRQLLRRLNRIDVLVVDDRVMAPSTVSSVSIRVSDVSRLPTAPFWIASG